jgi:hypothetical protein
MTDTQLVHLMLNLVTALRDLPRGQLEDDARMRALSMIEYLTKQKLLPHDARWHLGPNERKHETRGHQLLNDMAADVTTD